MVICDYIALQKAQQDYDLGLNLKTEQMIIMEQELMKKKAELTEQDSIITDLRSQFELQTQLIEDECAEQRAFDVETERVAAEEMEGRFAVCVLALNFYTLC